MKKLLIILASLFVLAGCETYSATTTVPVDRNVRVSVGVHSGYYDPYYYHPRPVIIHRHYHNPRPVIIHRHYHKKKYRHYDRHDRRYDRHPRRDHYRDDRRRRH